MTRNSLTIILWKERKGNKEIGNRIKALRSKQGLTQDALARKCDIFLMPCLQSRGERHNQNINPNPVAKIAKGLGVSIDELIK